MSNDNDIFDAVVVGAGPAGCAAAYSLASAGRSVVLVERGTAPGTKNLSGGVLYCAVLNGLVPGFFAEAPVERAVTRHATTFLTEDSSCTLDFRSGSLGTPPCNAFTVLRARFDAWFAAAAEAAGAFLMTGVTIDGPLVEDGAVVGVRAGEDTLRARVVIAADGVNSFLAQAAGLRPRNRTHHVAVGVKGVVRLPRETIEDRFNLAGEEGAACCFVGDVTRGLAGGGFVYTNLESLSLGVVVRVDELVKSGTRSSSLLQQFLQHPIVAPLVRGGELAEYGAHLVPEGGTAMTEKLYTDGMLVTGDAAGFAINNGLVVRGMDLAIGSGICAAETVIEALSRGDCSTSVLQGYERRLRESFVLRDLRTFERAPRFLDRHRLYRTYPQFLTTFFQGVFENDGTPRQHLSATARRAMRASGLKTAGLAGDALGAARAL